jgi:hypothetical protein
MYTRWYERERKKKREKRRAWTVTTRSAVVPYSCSRDRDKERLVDDNNRRRTHALT